jgi:hypothetical protein
MTPNTAPIALGTHTKGSLSTRPYVIHKEPFTMFITQRGSVRLALLRVLRTNASVARGER